MTPSWEWIGLAATDVVCIAALIRCTRVLRRSTLQHTSSAATMNRLVDENSQLLIALGHAQMRLATGEQVPADPELIEAVPPGYLQIHRLPIGPRDNAIELHVTRPKEGPPLVQLEVWSATPGALGPGDMTRTAAAQLHPSSGIEP